MIKRLCLLATLLVPSLAYGGTPSANLSVQVVPAGTTKSSQCPSVAPAEAQAAGFTTMALCNDFTQAIPNTAGTGLPTDWLGVMDAGNSCAYSDSSPHVWYQTLVWLGCSPPYNEAGGGIQQVTDPATGTLALRIGYTVSDQGTGGGYQYQSMTTMAPNFSNVHDYPQASLIEWTMRDNTESMAAGSPNNDIFTWTFADILSKVQGHGALPVLEYDIFEDWGVLPTSAGPNGAAHNWGAGNVAVGAWVCGVYGGHYADPGSGGHCPLPANFTTSVYHTYGLLTTTDGSAAIWICGYVDHVLMGCGQVPGSVAPSGSGGFGQRNFLINWLGITFDTGGFCPGGSTCLTQNLYEWIQSVRVWSCSDWNNPNGANYTCKGTVVRN